MLTQSEIAELSSAVIAKMKEEVPEIAGLSEGELLSLRQFFELGYVTGHVDATKEAIATINA